MAEATIKLTVDEVNASKKMRDLAQQIAAVGKAAKATGDTQTSESLGRAAKGINQVAGGFTQVEKDAKRATGALGEASKAVEAFGRGGGLGMAMNLVGIGGLVAFAGTAGALVANSIKLAYEFNRVSQMSTFSMSSNASTMLTNLARFKSEALGMADIGISGTQAAKMMGSYSLASGRGIAPGQGRTLGTYAQAYGLDQTSFAQQMGLLSQYAGPNVAASAGAVFGGAANAGDFGRRLPEFIATATNVLAGIQASNPFGRTSIADAIREITGITANGGYFASSRGLQTTLSGLNALGQNAMNDPAKAALLFRAGFTPAQILRGISKPEDLDRISRQVYKDTDGSEVYSLAMLKAYGLSQDQANAVYDAGKGHRGSIIGRYSNPANPNTRMAAAQTTAAMKLQETGAVLENTQIRMGDWAIDKFGGAVRDFALAVEEFERTGKIGGQSASDAVLDKITGGQLSSSRANNTAVGRKWYIDAAAAAARRHGLDPAIFAAQIEQESSWNPAAISKAGAVGLGQLTLGGEVYGRKPNIGDLAHALADPAGFGLDVAAAQMQHMLQIAHGEGLTGTAAYRAALNRYNSGQESESKTDGGSYSSDVFAKVPGEAKYITVPGGKLKVETKVSFQPGSNTRGGTSRTAAYR